MLDLTQLHADSPGVTSNRALAWAEQAEVCMTHNNHAPGVQCQVKHKDVGCLPVSWLPSGDQERMRAANADLQEATEGGATAVAIAYMKHVHNLVVTGRSPKDGNGFDFFLGPLGSGSFLSQSPSARLEVSGVLENGDVDCSARLREKSRQVTRSLKVGQSAFAVVVGFKKPSIWVESA